MATFKLAIGDPKAKKTFKAELSSGDAENLLGRRIGTKFRGELVGLTGYELEITGGSDKSGFPMWKSLEGQGRKRIILTDGFGFKAKRKGQRRRRSVAGNTISTETSQINCKVVKAGKDPIAKVLGAEEKKEEAPAEKSKEDAPKEEVKETPKEEPKLEKKEEAKAEVKEEKPEEELAKEEKKEEKAE